MMQTRMLLLATCLIAAAPSAAETHSQPQSQSQRQAQSAASPSRGELLYATHCIACHNREIHWRQRKLATDWASLEAQVRRWAENAGLGWSDEEIADVARYLNASEYRFEAPFRTEPGRQGNLRRAARAD